MPLQQLVTEPCHGHSNRQACCTILRMMIASSEVHQRCKASGVVHIILARPHKQRVLKHTARLAVRLPQHHLHAGARAINTALPLCGLRGIKQTQSISTAGNGKGEPHREVRAVAVPDAGPAAAVRPGPLHVRALPNMYEVCIGKARVSSKQGQLQQRFGRKVRRSRVLPTSSREPSRP